MVDRPRKMNSNEIKISRSDLIEVCDKFLADKITRADIENFANDLIVADNKSWDSDYIVSDTIYDWDNEEINYPINKTNMKLWRQRLLTGVDELGFYNFWNKHIDLQKQTCEKFQSTWRPINSKLFVGVSSDLLSDPIHGLRHPAEQSSTGWYIWTGEYSERDDFFMPLCAEHLLQLRPQIIKYLGLDVGYRFLTDSKGYEDVWFDEKITKT